MNLWGAAAASATVRDIPAGMTGPRSARLERMMSPIRMFAKDQSALNLRHAKDPVVGDYWHEMFCPIAVVVEVGRYGVVCCETTKSLPGRQWTWDLDAIHSYTRAEFASRFRYGRVGQPGFVGTDDLTKIENRFWPDVAPAAHAWVGEMSPKRDGEGYG